MFISTLLKRNPELISWSLYAHKTGMIPPNTYVIDLDTVRHNACLMKEKAEKSELNLYMMTKQIGRNPIVCDAIKECGIEKAVAVTMEEARILYGLGVKVGHIGHLVQIPECYIEEAIEIGPEVITVMDSDNAAKISRHTEKRGMRQNILLRVTDDDDMLFPQQYGGVNPEDLPDAIKRIEKMDGVELIGFTAFPCFKFDEDTGKTIRTNNFDTLRKSVEIGKSLGLNITQVNAPGGNACGTFEASLEYGATHLEPGHAFTGTTYQNSVDNACEEKPSMAYVTEVSHSWKGHSFVFGGGFYGRAEIKNAIVEEKGNLKVEKAFGTFPGTIDYYGELDCLRPIGTGVVYAFRTQIFMLNSGVAIVEGIGRENPRVIGIYNRDGRRIK